MLSWIFKKKEAAVAAPAANAATEPAAAGRSAQSIAGVPSKIDWQLKLQEAMGDDTALLALAHAGAPLDVMQAAVSALTSEAALKLAEREFRNKDRRVHRLAKLRHLAVVAQREARQQAAQLIETAKALANEPLIPANRLVELDRAWQALNTTLLDATQRNDFATALAQLSALTRERGDDTLKIERWTAQARSALAHLRTACADAAAGTHDRRHLAAAGATARAVFESAPAGDAIDALRDALRVALQHCEQVDARLAVLDDLLQVLSRPEPAPVADPHPNDAAPETAETPHDPAVRWQQLPPLVDTLLGDALNHRFEQWRHARDHAHQARRAQRVEQAKDVKRAARNEATDTLAAALERAEAALAAGHLADTNRLLVEIDELAHRGGAVAALRARSDLLQTEYARLKGWQHWGGGLARDELVLQAEALAATTGDADARVVKQSIKQQGEVIDDLRARWKELDRLGGATSRSMWQRFDEALTAAYQPVAAHMAAQRAAREQNLQARNQLVEALNAVALPDMNEGDAAPDWKLIAVEIEHFHTDWRKLGPLEHTVPHKERGKLVERMGAAVERLEVRLNEARRGAQLMRERLIARAKELSAEANTSAQGRELIGQVRELQAEWQHQAKAMPLARAADNTLWTEFKTAIDTIFSAREAAFSARDAEFKAHGAERATLIERLEGMAADTPPTALKRTLAEVEAQWQRAGPAPRQDAAALESRFRSARDTVRQLLADGARRDWHTTCDALAAKLALCQEYEHSEDSAAAKAALEQRWPGLPALPVAWEQALVQRASLIGVAQVGTSPITASTADLLLQLEAALELASPPAFEEARRALKLQAMKAALEGRQTAAAAALAPDSLLAAALGRTGLDGAQRERLSAIVAALFNRGPMGAS